MLGESLNNKFYTVLDDAPAQTLYRVLHNALGPEFNRTLRRALYRTLDPANDAALAQLQRDLKNVR